MTAQWRSIFVGQTQPHKMRTIKIIILIIPSQANPHKTYKKYTDYEIIVIEFCRAGFPCVSRFSVF